MKLIIQRVLQASVTVNDEVVSAIGRGLVVLVGISRDDQLADISYCVRKLLNVRLFEHEGQHWKKGVKDKDLEILCVSQFTLYHVLKGNKPDFHQAMGHENAKTFYETFLKQLGTSYKEEKIKDGVFGAMMQVNLTNDGPVTIDITSPTNTQEKGKKQNSQKSQNCVKAEATVEQSAPPAATPASPAASDTSEADMKT